MPTTFSDDMRQVADGLIGDLGKSATFRRVPSSYDPVAGETTENHEDTPVSVALEAYSVRQQDGTLVQVGDLQATVPAQLLDDAPTTSDRLLIDGEAWSVQRVNPVYAGERAVIYQLQVRR